MLTGEEPSSYTIQPSASGTPIQIGDRTVYVSLRSGGEEVREISKEERRKQLDRMNKTMKGRKVPKQHRLFVLGCMEE